MRDPRPGILLAVIIGHIAVILLLLRASRPEDSASTSRYEPMVLLFLRDRAPVAVAAPRAPKVLPPAKPAEPGEAPSTRAAAPTAPSTSAQPPIDWQHEAEVAAQNGVAAAQNERDYRDLSALSPEQLSWVRQNHMQRAPPGIAWTHPRFEFDRTTGLPILWINDHCVLVTVFVFCGIGHIEANGHLFDHMRDPRDPADPAE